nr:HNH endonuclease signature motif containing protein [Mycolicibacterium holsaticum]
MSSGATSDRETIVAAFDALDSAFDSVLGLQFDVMTDAEKLALTVRLERNMRRAPAVGHRLLSALAAEADPRALGGTSLADVLSTTLRISKKAANQRIKDADRLGPRHALTGEPLDPKLPNVAAAQQRGEVGDEHVRVITKFFDKLPSYIPADLCDEMEAHLADLASGLGPEQLRKSAEKLAYLANQDGDPPTDDERARKREFNIHEQDRDGMSRVSGYLDPEARAILEAGFAKYAAPGMCNPDDETPCVEGEPDADAKAADLRSAGQRRHDALKALGRAMLASGQLGQHNGLPATIIVSTTLQELESGAGHAVTAGGSLLPMSDLIRLASHAYHYLVVFDKHTQEALYLGRTKRFASPGQRIVLHAKDRGCSRPGCTVPGYWCQVHHVDGWAADDGHTDVDKLTFACGPDNRLVETGNWTTRKRADGRTEWIPPPHLDTGQRRVNDYHFPERYLLPDDDDDVP